VAGKVFRSVLVKQKDRTELTIENSDDNLLWVVGNDGFKGRFFSPDVLFM